MKNEVVNKLRQLLCKPDTPALRGEVCALCTEPILLAYAEESIPGLGQWWDRQQKISQALARHKLRYDEDYDYYECRFSKLNLPGADLVGADLSQAYLYGANLTGADLSVAFLRAADLYATYLSGADMTGADLSGADLRWSELRRVDLYATYLSGADLTGAKMRDARYNKHTVFPEGFDPLEAGMVQS